MSKISIGEISLVIFDFDGVLTNNSVYVDENGKETVRCSRADGIGFDAMRKMNIQSYIISSEKNQVVSRRAKKLKVPTFQGVKNKWSLVCEIAQKHKIDTKKILFVGNDINDYQAINNCGFSACPADSHKKIKEVSKFILKKNGGNGIVREIVEDLLGLDLIKILYLN